VATATAPAPAEAPAVKSSPKASVEGVALALADGELPAADLLAKAGERALTIAWTGGYVEFGHRDYSVTGNPDNPKTQEASELHVESGESWTGPKTLQHCPLRLLLDRGVRLPRVGAYKINRAAEANYVPVPDVSPLAKVTREEAEKLVYLKARLTDKGHQLLIAE
jgi:hypothetical protein